MIIGLSRYYGIGGSRPVLGYLTGYLNNGPARDTKPEVLRGSPQDVAEIIDTLPFQRRYTSGVLSFAAEDQVTPEMQEDIMDRFESAVFAGIPADRRSIVFIKHTDKKRTEIHFVIPRVDLGTGRSLNIAPPTPASRHLLDSLREGINRRYGFRDPSDPECAQAVSLPAHVAKLAAQAKRLGRSPKADIRQVIAQRLEEQARAGVVTSRADVIRSLKEQGFAITREGVNYLTIVRPDTGERVRLKGNIFREHFCPKDLERIPARRDPAQLLALDRRLGRLVEKRATYHRARYGVEEQSVEPMQLKEEFTHDRTRSPFIDYRPAIGANTPGTGAAIGGNPLRLDEAAQRYGNATHSLECARQRLDQTHRAFTQDFDQAVIDAERNNRAEALVQAYGLQQRQRSQQPGMELELEL
jgi:hypothetical protein